MYMYEYIYIHMYIYIYIYIYMFIYANIQEEINAKANPKRARRLFVLAALEVEKFRDKTLKVRIQKRKKVPHIVSLYSTCALRR